MNELILFKREKEREREEEKKRKTIFPKSLTFFIPIHPFSAWKAHKHILGDYIELSAPNRNAIANIFMMIRFNFVFLHIVHRWTQKK
jgi:hypothetical protein